MRRDLIPGLIGIALFAIAIAAIGIHGEIRKGTPSSPPPAAAATATPDHQTPPQFYRIRLLFNSHERKLKCRDDQQMTHVVIGQDDEPPAEFYALGQPGETAVWMPYTSNDCLVGQITDQPLPARFRR